MKKPWLVGTGSALAFALAFILHAQETTVSDESGGTAGDTAVMIAAVEQTTPTPAAALPEAGTFWSAQNPESAPLPADVINVPAWSLGDDVFLLDDRLTDYPALAAAAQRSGTLRPLGFTPAFNFFTDSNLLWLQMVTVTNQTASLIIHPPAGVTNGIYDLFYTTNLDSPIAWGWVMRSNPGQTNLTVPNATDAQGFYRLGTANDLTANDSLGTNFWLLIPGIDGVNSLTTGLSLTISCQVAASGTVTIPFIGFTNTFTLAAGTVTNMPIPLQAMISDDSDLEPEYGVETNGIEVMANAPVAVYGVDYYAGQSVVFTCYPVPLLGTNYCIMNYFSPGGSGFALVATAAGTTTVTITPSATALLGGIETNVFTLQQGQTYQAATQGDDDYSDAEMTGTFVTSDQPIAVFAGPGAASVPQRFTHGYADYDYGNTLVQQQLPVEDWGTQALALSFAGRLFGDTYRVLAAYTNTVITISGKVVTVSTNDGSITESNEVVVVTNQAGQYYEIMLDGPAVFQGSQPIQVAQFANSHTFDYATDAAGNPVGDPCEILLLPTGHWLMTNIVFTLPNDDTNGDFNENYLNIIAAQSAITNTLVDGSHISSTNFVAIGSSGYYGTQFTVTNSGVHKVTSSQPVGVEVYGFANPFDAYGYFGGVVK